jgi:hypothetical protein
VVNARPEKLEDDLRQKAEGRHVIVVRYTRNLSPREEWVYNRADIGEADVVWARDMGERENRKLSEYFRDRRIWLLEPGDDPDRLQLYEPR